MRTRPFIHLLLVAGLLCAATSACDKNDDPIEDGQSAGKLKDAEGNKYETVKIGTQVWMAENLKTTEYNDGTEIPNVTNNTEWENLTTGAYCNYENLESNAKTYGRLYNYWAINNGKIAPEGWHVPTDEDWTILENYLIAKGYNYDGTKEENKLAKSLAATTGWKLTDEAGTPGANPEENNSTGFVALPGGYRGANGIFANLGTHGYWWSNTPGGGEYVFYRRLFYGGKNLFRDSYFTELGFSIRLVRD